MPDPSPSQREAALLGMWSFLATEIMFFGVLFGAYPITRLQHPQGFVEASRHTDILLGTANTAILLTSSLTMTFGVRAAMLCSSFMHLGSSHALIRVMAFGALFWLVILRTLSLSDFLSR